MFFYRLCGVVCILIGISMTSFQLIWTKVKEMILMELPLVDGTVSYETWLSPVHLTYGCYLFNVTNPDDVMRGDKPNLVETGPFVYDEMFQRHVLDIDQEMDEITYVARSLYSFNKDLSINMSKHDKVTILNPAYIGSIALLATVPPDFMKKYGNHIPKLFPNRSSIFLTARPNDILFNGVKVMCNVKKFPELSQVCNTLKANPPPVLSPSGKEDVFLLSIFQRFNATYRGPFTINRGLKNLTRLGDTTSYKGKRVQTVWSSESCNTVRGTDTITWPPLMKPLPFVSTFISDLCRSIEADYVGDVWVKGLRGSRFVMKERSWFLNNTKCYCLLENRVPQCLPRGIIDVSACQNVPALISEPHFLHGDPELLTYARGLKPDERIHETSVTIEPYTGTPLTGSKKVQVNLKLMKQPVELLFNVSEGYFPILWCENGNTPTLPVIIYTYQTLRLVNMIWFLEKVPLIVGIYMVLMSLLYCDRKKCNVQPITSPTESILLSSDSGSNNAVRRPSRRFAQAFE